MQLTTQKEQEGKRRKGKEREEGKMEIKDGSRREEGLKKEGKEGRGKT